jgi:hypothetical protein
LELAPTDYSVKLLVDRYEEELSSLSTPSGTATGTPRVLFHVPKTARHGDVLDLVAHVLPRNAGPHAAIVGVKMSLRQTLSGDGSPLEMIASGDGTFSGHTSVLQVGRSYIVFEASVAGTLLRAERPVDVSE